MTAGIVAEYNPLHLGHAWHLEQTKAAEHLITVVMSGHFVQRGDVAVFTKYTRARAAILAGADLVVELPLPWAMSPAQSFARGAVGILRALGCVDTLSFGSESGSRELLQSAAEAADSPFIRQRMKELLQSGITFAKARETAVRELISPAAADALRRPNDTLGAAYLRAMKNLGFSASVLTFPRMGQPHDSPQTKGPYLSASALREMLREGTDIGPRVPEQVRELFSREIRHGRGPVSIERLESALLSRLRLASREEIARLPDLSEGLENRLYDAIRQGRDFSEICFAAKTKRYPMARIRRLLLSAALGITAGDVAGTPPYIRVLAVGENGREILKAARKQAALPIIMRAADTASLDNRGKRIYDLECMATDFYSLAFSPAGPCGLEQRASAEYIGKVLSV